MLIWGTFLKMLLFLPRCFLRSWNCDFISSPRRLVFGWETDVFSTLLEQPANEYHYLANNGTSGRIWTHKGSIVPGPKLLRKFNAVSSRLRLKIRYSTIGIDKCLCKYWKSPREDILAVHSSYRRWITVPMFLKMNAILHDLHVRSPKKHLYIRLCHTSKWNMEIKFNLRTRDPLPLSLHSLAQCACWWCVRVVALQRRWFIGNEYSLQLWTTCFSYNWSSRWKWFIWWVMYTST